MGRIVGIPPHLRKCSAKTQDITRHALKIWDNLHKREHWEYNSPLIPLKDTEYFVPGIEDLFGKWIKDIMRQDKICTYQELKDKDNLLVIDPWRYNQLIHFIDSLPHPIRTVENLLPLEKICMEKKRKGGFFKIYRALREMGDFEAPPYIKKWEMEWIVGLKTRKCGRYWEGPMPLPLTVSYWS